MAEKKAKKSLVIVESPAKAKTLERFLGKHFFVKASFGHVRDLPKSKLGVDVENNFEPQYITIKGKTKTINELKKAAEGADQIFLAPDPDREGEAIAYHLAQALLSSKKVNKEHIYRIEFNEITKQAVTYAIEHPREINLDRFYAQQARRVLDRLVGYKLSPLLWQKIRRGLSAGRVQSVAVRIICEREREIQAFKPVEYWSIEGLFKTSADETVRAQLYGRVGDKEKIKINNGQEAQALVSQLEGGTYQVADVVQKEKRRNPTAPFITSTLQQEASRKLGWGARKTMMVAQQLYEGIDLHGESTGLISYMRTDSVRISEQAIGEVRAAITQWYGAGYLPESANVYKSKGRVQDAHEAIRPTHIEYAPDSIKNDLTLDQLKLYRLVWQRFVACQMAPAILDVTSVEIQGNGFVLRASGSVIKFDGFMKVYLEGQDEDKRDEDAENLLPLLTPGQAMALAELLPAQHFTQPPPRFTEASLVKFLEEQGIGRPSTYAPIMSTIQDRGYVGKESKALVPTDLGLLINDQLVKHFSDIVDVGFTADMEAKLDMIDDGSIDWRQIVRNFFEPFEKDLKIASDVMEKINTDEKTDEVCEKCGSPMIIKTSRYGRFIACSGYPNCKNTRSLVADTGVVCPECGSKIVERRSKRGKIFYGCSGYPKCTFAVWDKPTGDICPQTPCKGFLVIKRARGKAPFKKCVKCEYELHEQDQTTAA